MECFYTEDRGMGVRASANLREGDFIIEYCGEVIDSTEFERRQIKVYSKHDFYGMCITNGMCIDTF
jgi:SET domain-containing protein